MTALINPVCGYPANPLPSEWALRYPPQQLADMLDAKTKKQDTRYADAHEALTRACAAVAELREDHYNAEAVSALVDQAFDLFEDTVSQYAHQPPEREPTLAQEEADAEYRAELRSKA